VVAMISLRDVLNCRVADLQRQTSLLRVCNVRLAVKRRSQVAKKIGPRKGPYDAQGEKRAT